MTMATGRPRYLAYTLRPWQVGGKELAWRASLESPHTGERCAFASLEALFAFLVEKKGKEINENWQIIHSRIYLCLGGMQPRGKDHDRHD